MIEVLANSMVVIIIQYINYLVNTLYTLNNVMSIKSQFKKSKIRGQNGIPAVFLFLNIFVEVLLCNKVHIFKVYNLIKF